MVSRGHYTNGGRVSLTQWICGAEKSQRITDVYILIKLSLFRLADMIEQNQEMLDEDDMEAAESDTKKTKNATCGKQ